MIESALFVIVLCFEIAGKDLESIDLEIFVERLLVFFGIGLLGLGVPLLFVGRQNFDVVARIRFVYPSLHLIIRYLKKTVF